MQRAIQRNLVLPAVLAALFALPLGELAAQDSRPATPDSRPAGGAPRTTTPDPARFAKEIQSFTEWDRRNAFPRDSVLFVGSSSIRGWPTAQSFPDLPVINRGFGGSHVRDVVHYFEQVIQPYHARAIVTYVGDNDIAAGLTPEQVRDDYRELLARIRAVQPVTPVLILSVKPSASRWQHWPAMQAANQLLAELAAADAQVTFVDLGAPLLGADGRPRPELYLKDELHLNSAGYEVWTQALRPVLERTLGSRTVRLEAGS